MSSTFFGVSHFDPVHILAVVPLGVWLGVVAWRSDFFLPSMLCHFAQNSFALSGTRLTSGSNDSWGKGLDAPQLIFLGVAGALTIRAPINRADNSFPVGPPERRWRLCSSVERGSL